MYKKDRKVETSINEFLNLRDVKDKSIENLKSLLNKMKSIVPKEKIDNYIKDNKEEVEKFKDEICDENGNIDYTKVNKIINRLF